MPSDSVVGFAKPVIHPAARHADGWRVMTKYSLRVPQAVTEIEFTDDASVVCRLRWII